MGVNIRETSLISLDVFRGETVTYVAIATKSKFSFSSFAKSAISGSNTLYDLYYEVTVIEARGSSIKSAKAQTKFYPRIFVERGFLKICGSLNTDLRYSFIDGSLVQDEAMPSQINDQTQPQFVSNEEWDHFSNATGSKQIVYSELNADGIDKFNQVFTKSLEGPGSVKFSVSFSHSSLKRPHQILSVAILMNGQSLFKQNFWINFLENKLGSIF